MYLMVPKLRNQGYIPFFVTERKRSEAALIQVVQEAFVQGVSTRKMEKLARSLGIENLSRSQVSEMTKGLNEQVQYFRSRPLTGRYPVIWTDRCTV
jgi:putative transposase